MKIMVFTNVVIFRQVVVIQVNGRENSSHVSHVLHVGKMRIKLCKGRVTKAKEHYSSSMQVIFLNENLYL